MTKNQENNWQDLTLKSLEDRLRHLPDVEVPETLQNKLLTAVVDRQPEVTREYRIKWHWRVFRFGATAAAAILIIALMFMVDYGLSIPSQLILTELNDTSLCYTRWDQYNFMFEQNSTYVEKSLPYELKWPVINLNEPVY